METITEVLQKSDLKEDSSNSSSAEKIDEDEELKSNVENHYNISPSSKQTASFSFHIAKS